MPGSILARASLLNGEKVHHWRIVLKKSGRQIPGATTFAIRESSSTKAEVPRASGGGDAHS